MCIRDRNVSDNSIAKMLYNWKSSGLVVIEGGLFKKIATTCQ